MLLTPIVYILILVANINKMAFIATIFFSWLCKKNNLIRLFQELSNKCNQLFELFFNQVFNFL